MKANALATSRVACAMVIVAALFAACDDPSVNDEVVVGGRIERGLSVSISVAKAGATVGTFLGDYHFSPSDAVVFDTASKTFKLLRAGTLVITVDRPGGAVTRSVDVALPPTILFDMVSAGNRDIYSASLDGLDLVRLTTGVAVEVHPSGAKNTIVYTSFRDGNAEIYSRGTTAASPEIRRSTTDVNEADVELSPDGLHLVYTRDDGGLPRVWVADATNSNAVMLTTASGNTVEGTPSWHSSSDSVLLMSTVLGNATIYRSGRFPGSIPASAAKPKTGDSVFVEPVWDRDARTIAFAAAVTGGASRIAVFTRLLGTAAMVTPAAMSAGQPVYLADGRIVFTTFSAAGASSLAWVDPGVPGEIHSISLPGTNPQHPAIIWP